MGLKRKSYSNISPGGITMSRYGSRLALAQDPRMKYLGIFNSGQLNTHDIAPKITKPVFYFLGKRNDPAMSDVCPSPNSEGHID